MQLPLKADADMVQDAQGRIVATIDSSVATGEAIKIAKLLALAPTMFELLGDLYVVFAMIAKNSDINHGSPDEQDKEHCPLCRCEAVLNSI
jgi:hypothetical protein